MDSKTPRFRRNGQRRLLITLGIVAVTAMASDARSQTPQLHLVSTAWPPFTNPPGQARFALDLVNEALKRIGSSADTTIVDESSFTTSLLSGKFDGSAAAWRDAEREKVLVYSAPYLENRLILVGRRGSDVSAPKLSALAGKRIVLVGGYSYGDETIDGSGAVFIRSRSEEDSLAKLLANEADYTLMDELVVQYILDNYSEQARNRLSIGSIPLITRTLHLAIRRSRPGAEALIDRFNTEVRRMIADHTYHRLLHVDWIEADVDGDGKKELVAGTDRVGPTPPARSYDLFAATPPPQVEVTAPPPPADKRFYFGGSIYENWASVPQNYKLSNSDAPDPSRSTATLFSFRW
jgi:polar amino acid transport system substrate-binding protein